MSNTHIVVNTNVLISGVAFPAQPPNQALRKAIKEGVLVFSKETISEFKDVLLRPKFDKYIDKRLREKFLVEIITSSLIVQPAPCKIICRDPKDQKFLEILNVGAVDFLITGDKDLLVLEKVGACFILPPAEFLERPLISSI